jgi:hypothetical protein
MRPLFYIIIGWNERHYQAIIAGMYGGLYLAIIMGRPYEANALYQTMMHAFIYVL